MTDTSRQNIDIIIKYVEFKYKYTLRKLRVIEFPHEGKSVFAVTAILNLTPQDYVTFRSEDRIGKTEEEAVELYLKFIFNGTESLNSIKMKLAIAGKL